MAGQTFFGGSLPAKLQHIGRRWSGPDSISFPEILDEPCGCVIAPCGLTVWGQWNPECPFHGIMKTIRQSHSAEDCPGAHLPS